MLFSLSVKKFLRYFFRAVFLAKGFVVVYLQKIMVLDFVVVLAALGLSCGTQDLCCIMQDFSLQC